jgi:hypothetical protein
MKLDIFSIPVFIDNIDSSKINISFDKLNKKWASETSTSFGIENRISEKSIIYLLSNIAENLKDFFIDTPFKVELIEIWENIYKENDFQENHIHLKSDFSFVIYKEVKESKTLFFSPDHFLIDSFYQDNFLKNYFKTTFFPKLTKNQIIIFPSFLEHMVKKNTESITIAGNLKIIK